MKNLTPEHLRCGPIHCPSVHELDDGSLPIVGKRTSVPAEILATMDLASEEAVIIDRALLADISLPLGDSGELVRAIFKASDDAEKGDHTDWSDLFDKAADAIVSLQSEVKRLTEALELARKSIDIKNLKIDDLVEQANVNYSSRAHEDNKT